MDNLKIFESYIRNGFKLFPCRVSKSPDVKKGVDWRDSKVHLTAEQAAVRVVYSNYIGAWIPENIIIIDVDNHDISGDSKKGIDYFDSLLKSNNCKEDLLDTFTVKTVSGGYHLYYLWPNREINTGAKLTKGVDIKTNTGYVIAAGCSGYTIKNKTSIKKIPDFFKKLIEEKQIERYKSPQQIKIEKPLSLKKLKAVLKNKNLNPENFRSNDKWLEFIMAVIATCGNNESVIELLVDWSKQDEIYKQDKTIELRIKSIVPEGGITPGTFLFILRTHGISDYMILSIRDEIGGTFLPEPKKTDYFSFLPIKIDFKNLLLMYNEQVASFFYNVRNTAPAELLAHILKGHFIYVSGERKLYMFDGNKWKPFYDIHKLIYSILLQVCDFFYIKKLQEDPDNDIDELRLNVYRTLQKTHWKKEVKEELLFKKQIHHENIKWDNETLAETLTLKDCVLDFTGASIVIRKGKPKEWRKEFFPMTKEKFENLKSEPENFKNLIKQVFPNEDTAKCALKCISLCVSGLSSHRVFQVWHGYGRNGKSTLIEILKKFLGNRAITYDTNILLPGRNMSGNSLTPELATFRGALAAFGNESESNRKLKTAVIKSLVGGDTITANPKYQNPFSFVVTSQLILASNYLPGFDTSDKAFIDRLIVLPFVSFFYYNQAEKEKFSHYPSLFPAIPPIELQKRIKKEYPGILKLLISVYLELRDGKEKGRIKQSTEMLICKKDYIKDNDDIGEFIRRHYTFEENEFVIIKDITNLYRDYVSNNNLTSQYITNRICLLYPNLKRGAKYIKGKTTRVILGLKQKEDCQEQAQSAEF